MSLEISSPSSQFLHHPFESAGKRMYVWENTSCMPFDEAIFSWEAERPAKGTFVFRVCLWIKEWTDWLDYAYWGSDTQFTLQKQQTHFRTDQDTIQVLSQKKATGFKISIEAREGASLAGFRRLHANLTDLCRHYVKEDFLVEESVALQVPKISQIAVRDSRNVRICSPVATVALLRYLSPKEDVDLVSFVDLVRDATFDLYGNWIFNTAQVSHQLGKQWHCGVVRLHCFSRIYASLQENIPVVVSVKGPLKGSALPYENGHLLVVRGYDAKEKKVLCMDPAFPSDHQTYVSYDWLDFWEAWSRRSGLSYLFWSPQRPGATDI